MFQVYLSFVFFQNSVFFFLILLHIFLKSWGKTGQSSETSQNSIRRFFFLFFKYSIPTLTSCRNIFPCSAAFPSQCHHPETPGGQRGQSGPRADVQFAGWSSHWAICTGGGEEHAKHAQNSGKVSCIAIYCWQKRGFIWTVEIWFPMLLQG